jgi:hypothetical protein
MKAKLASAHSSRFISHITVVTWRKTNEASEHNPKIFFLDKYSLTWALEEKLKRMPASTGSSRVKV